MTQEQITAPTCKVLNTGMEQIQLSFNSSGSKVIRVLECLNKLGQILTMKMCSKMIKKPLLLITLIPDLMIKIVLVSLFTTVFSTYSLSQFSTCNNTYHSTYISTCNRSKFSSVYRLYSVSRHLSST